MSGRSILAGLALSVALAAPAGASTLVRGPGGGLSFTAAPGVENDLSIFGDPSPPATLIINTADDPVAYSAQNPLPEQCADVDQDNDNSQATTVSCSGTPTITIDVGDLGDRVTSSGATSNVRVEGGPGDDALTGGGGRELLFGGGGADEISGGPGDDLIDGGSEADVLDGGDGLDTIFGSAGDDQVRGGPGRDDLRGNDGDDDLFGESGHDTLSGGADDDALQGGEGDDELIGDGGLDSLTGGADDDTFYSSSGADTVRGDEGTDTVFARGDGDANDLDGGAGSDRLVYVGDASLTIDLAAGTAKPDGPAFVAVGFEDLQAEAEQGTYLGTSGANLIFGNYGTETIDPRAGNDVVQAFGGDDFIELRDGFADRVDCGAGTDTVQADTLDEVAADCENVTRTDVGNANDVPEIPEDKAPTVAITAPAASALLSTIAPNTITADASDDRGIARVIFSTGERTLCTDESAPYSCDYRPTSADVGRDTLVVIAVDTAGQTASAVRVVSVPRFKAMNLGAATSPKRDREAPYRFTTRGKLALPTGVLPAAGCKGTVSVSFKAGKKTVSTRRVGVRSDCTYTSRVTFRLPSRLRPKTLGVVAVFSGNGVVEGIRAKRGSVRTR